MKKELKAINAAVFVLVAIVCFGVRSTVFTNDERPAAIDREWYLVSRVIDGDTMVLSDGRRVRLIGVDTPEVYYSEKLLKDSRRSGEDVAKIQALGRRASDFTRKLCLGRKVRLEYDVETKDRYRRTLAYVYLEDGTFVNARIVEEGFGQVMTVPPNVKHAELFLKLQKEARDSARGLWKT